MKKARSPNGTRKLRVLTNAQRRAHALRSRDYRAEKKMKLAREHPESVRVSVIEQRSAVRARAVAAKMVENPSLSVGDAARAVGLPESIATHPAQIVNTKEWNELLDEMLPRSDLLNVHKGLLKASRIDHLTFTRDGEPSDEEITLMLSENNCTVRKIVHGEQARHVYFFAPDNKARTSALEMAYKLRGDFATDKAAVAFSLVALARTQQEGIEPPAGNMPRLPDSV